LVEPNEVSNGIVANTVEFIEPYVLETAKISSGRLNSFISSQTNGVLVKFETFGDFIKYVVEFPGQYHPFCDVARFEIMVLPSKKPVTDPKEVDTLLSTNLLELVKRHFPSPGRYENVYGPVFIV
jgi:hypothetical protein